jgi:hypothetical protein
MENEPGTIWPQPPRPPAGGGVAGGAVSAAITRMWSVARSSVSVPLPAGKSQPLRSKDLVVLSSYRPEDKMEDAIADFAKKPLARSARYSRSGCERFWQCSVF